jgi:hypothetical protein
VTALAILGVARAADPGLAGLVCAAVCAAERGLAAVVAPAESVAAAAARVALTADVAGRLGAFLPVAAGAAQRGALRLWLSSEVETLRRGLAHVEGCDEWIVTLRRPRPSPPDVRTAGGAEWLRGRAAAARADAEASADAAAALAPTAAAVAAIARATLLRPFRARDVVGVDLAVLLPRGAEAALRDRLALAEAPLALSGPWPAYSFAAGDAA